MKPEEQQAAVLENVLADLRAQGFDVFVQPSRQALPAFLKGHSPDAIAIRDDRKLVIEVLSPGPSSGKSLTQLREALSKESGWELRAVWVSSTNIAKSIEQVSPRTIDQSIKSVKSLLSANREQPALLMAWATFEALGRALLPEKFSRPQTPGRLVDVLAEGGQLTPTEADQLRPLANLRNQLIHGGLQVPVSRENVEGFVAILETLKALLPSRQSETGNIEPREKGLRSSFRTSSGEIRRVRSDTLVSTLRKEYGSDFAKGYRSDTKLSALLKREGVKTLDQFLKKYR